jgi:hypothetical protein
MEFLDKGQTSNTSVRKKVVAFKTSFVYSVVYVLLKRGGKALLLSSGVLYMHTRTVWLQLCYSQCVPNTCTLNSYCIRLWTL